MPPSFQRLYSVWRRSWSGWNSVGSCRIILESSGCWSAGTIHAGHADTACGKTASCGCALLNVVVEVDRPHQHDGPEHEHKTDSDNGFHLVSRFSSVHRQII